MFRYSAKQHNDSLLKLGIIRIGTLHDFRKSEHNRGISDSLEGKKQVSHYIEKLHVPTSSDLAVRSTKDFKAIETFALVKPNSLIIDATFINVSLSMNIYHPNCFVLCTSNTAGRATLREFEGADTCVQIHDILNFYKLLTATLNSITPVEFMGIHKVIYGEKNEAWNGLNWGHRSALIKGTDYINQDEIRAIWAPKFKQKIEPVIIGNFRLCETCHEKSI